MYVVSNFFLFTIIYGIVSSSIIDGGGSPLPFSLFTKWSYSFMDVIPRIIVKYSVSSGTLGLSNVLSGELMFSGAFTLRDMENAAYQFPICGSPIVVLYNLPNITIPLKLDRQSMIDIFSGKIRKWKDPHLIGLNPFLETISDQTIKIYLGLNNLPIMYLSAALSEWSDVWRENYGTFSEWPNTILNATDAILLSTTMNTLMIGYVQATPYSLTFGLLSDSFDIGVSYALLTDGNTTLDAALTGDLIFNSSVVVNSQNFSDLISNTINSPIPGMWPIIGLTFAVIPLRPVFSCQEYSDMLKFFVWALTSDAADTAANRSGYMPIEFSISLLVSQYLQGLQCRGYPAMSYTIEPKDTSAWGALLCLVISYLGMVALIIMTRFSWGDNRVTQLFHGSLSCASFMALLSITFWWLEPTNIVCQFRIWLFGLGSTMVMASVFNYMWRFYLVNKTIVEEQKWNKKIPVFETTLAAMVIFLVLELVLLSVWTVLDPYIQQYNSIDDYDLIGTYSCGSNSIAWMSTQYAYFFALNLWGIYAVTVTWTLQTKQVRWVIMSIYTTLVTMIVLFVYTQLTEVNDLELLYISTVFVVVVAIGFNVSVLVPKVIEAHSSEGVSMKARVTSENSLKMRVKGNSGEEIRTNQKK